MARDFSDRVDAGMGGREAVVVHEFGRDPVSQLRAAEPFEHLAAVGPEEPGDLDDEAVGTPDALRRSPVRRVGALDRLPEGEPERRTDRIIVQRALAAEVGGCGEGRLPFRLAREVAPQRGTDRRRVLHLLGGLLVERLSQRLEREGDDGVPVQRVRERRRTPVERHLERRRRQILLALEIIGDAGGVESHALRNIREGHALRALFVDHVGRRREDRVALCPEPFRLAPRLGRDPLFDFHRTRLAALIRRNSPKAGRGHGA